MKKHVIFFAIALFFAFGCSSSETGPKFKSLEYQFSFDYSDGWAAVERDLPDKWAIKDSKDNTILFIVSKNQQNDLRSLGVLQALNDVYPESATEGISEEELRSVEEMVKIQTFNGKEWFTYGVSFEDIDTQSLISGTICNENEVLLVLVTDSLSYESSKLEYNKILGSFKC